jgi:alpha-tubulin suppressor-like RCC1 family protein
MKTTITIIFKNVLKSSLFNKSLIDCFNCSLLKKHIVTIGLLAFILLNSINSHSQTISGGLWHSVFLCNTGIPYSTGYNYYGQLGDGTTVNRNSPVQVNSLSGIIAVAAGQYHSIFLKNDGTVWTCGDNSYGQLGDGTTTKKTTPIQISSLSGIIAISTGGNHSLFLKNDGTVWACGSNSYGQLGDGTTNNKSIPVKINSLSNIVAISACKFSSFGSHSLFLKSDGTVWGCGLNNMGQLGDINNNMITSPVQITSLSGIIAIAAGGRHSLFLKNDGTVWSLGDNFYGQLGDGTFTNRTSPVQITSLSGIIAISAGIDYSLFLKNDGTVWACGNAEFGKLGDGSNSGFITTPIQITSLSGIVNIAAGFQHSLFLKNDGTVWACGKNLFGQLGDGTTGDKSITHSN